MSINNKSMSIEDMVKIAPKAELHVHIEGTMEPELLFELAQKNNISLNYTIDQCREERKNQYNLKEFLIQYNDACKVLISENDFYAVAIRYFTKAISHNVVYCEVFFDPQTYMANGVSFETIIKGLSRASEEIKDRLQAKWIMCFLRHLPEADCLALISQAEPFVHLIHGIGLDSLEEGNPARKHENVFRIAEEKGLCGNKGTNKTAHAGEESDASNVISSLYHLNVPRIDHGVRSLDCLNLCKALKQSEVALTLCPLSNIKLKVKERFFPDTQVVKELFNIGVRITINSDRPEIFGGYINENYLCALEEFEEDERKFVLRQLLKNSFLASFIEEDEKVAFCAKVDEALDSL